MKIQTNTAANAALGNMRVNSQATERSIQRLSSGFRINRAADDAAGLAIANKLRNDSKALQQAQRNGAQASAMLQIADGGVQTIASILDRMKELASASASSNIGTERGKLDSEFQQLNDEIQRIVDTTKYQGVSLLNGTGGGTVKVDATSTALTTAGGDVAKVTLGANAASGKTWTISSDMDANGVVSLSDGTTTYKALAVDGAQTLTFAEAGVTIETAQGFKIGDGTDPASFDGLTVVTAAGVPSGSALSILVGATGVPGGADKIDISLPAVAKLSGTDLNSMTSARTAMANIDTLLGTVNSFIGTLGSVQSRVDFANQNVAVTLQNTQAAESTIRDADMAYEMTQFTKNNILSQAAQSMLSQANQGTQGILQLLRG
jgi:flagellin